jgi:hypothetical protein
MSNQLWTAHLQPSSPRFEAWAKILGGDTVPLVSPRTYRANFGDQEINVSIYKLDIGALTVEQRKRLVNFIAETFGAAPAVIDQELETIGFPIREVDVIVGFSLRAFI